MQDPQNGLSLHSRQNMLRSFFDSFGWTSHDVKNAVIASKFFSHGTIIIS